LRLLDSVCAASNQGDGEGADGKNNQAAHAIDQSKPGFIGGGYRRELLGETKKVVKKVPVIIPVGGTNQGQAGAMLGFLLLNIRSSF
jgi:hypothetical protein